MEKAGNAVLIPGLVNSTKNNMDSKKGVYVYMRTRGVRGKRGEKKRVWGEREGGRLFI